MKAKAQSIRLDPADVQHLRAIKREVKLPTSRIIGAAVRGWKFLTDEQKLAAITGKQLPEPSVA